MLCSIDARAWWHNLVVGMAGSRAECSLCQFRSPSTCMTITCFWKLFLGTGLRNRSDIMEHIHYFFLCLLKCFVNYIMFNIIHLLQNLLILRFCVYLVVTYALMLAVDADFRTCLQGQCDRWQIMTWSSKYSSCKPTHNFAIFGLRVHKLRAQLDQGRSLTVEMLIWYEWRMTKWFEI